MPPKQGKASKPVTIDKTFGMKNKNKSAKVQNTVAQMKEAASRKGKAPEDLRKEELRAAEKKAREDIIKLQKAEAALNKPLQPQKVAFGVDPKTVLCQYYKAGFCEKAQKCKFSHDKDVGRRVEKRNLYADDRGNAANPGAVDPNDKSKDTMDTWDDEKLAKVVLSKYGNPKTTTDIVCKHFIEAVEKGSYGWFWVCPNGDECFYRHALPPGFVLNSEKKKKEAAAKAQVITLEEFLESERHKLGKNLTPVTEESFAIWKKTRLDKKSAEEEAANKLKGVAAQGGKLTGMSGRDLFTFNPDWFKDEDGEDLGEDEVDLDQYERHSENGAPEESHGNGEDDDDEEAEMEEEEGAVEGEVEEKLKDLTLSGQADGEEDGGKLKKDDVVEG